MQINLPVENKNHRIDDNDNGHGLVLGALLLLCANRLLGDVGRDGLLDLAGLAVVFHNQGVQVSGRSHLELGVAYVLLYADGLAIGTRTKRKELLDVSDFLWH
eukprot:TRINITY_DN4087_c0_g1_i1.p1 TRINITY_DN4087_c0_g1~~TRINITY_DN4087_c0_g1_i1.p1  ORF type:complete len:103 (-),score=19.11 TRINITY_DN4087_c0_g1_i1:29-337(-)